MVYITDNTIKDTFRPPELAELPDNEFAILLKETKRFAETRWSPKIRRVNVTDTNGTTAPLHLFQVWAGSRPEVATYTSDGQGLGETQQENNHQD
jgi:hypothetical protein